MGTRADFYLGKGAVAKWLGSVAWDGYWEGIPEEIMKSSEDEHFEAAVKTFLQSRTDGTLPEMGWPWPWEDSGTSDCSYWFFDGKVWQDVDGRYVPAHEDPYKIDDVWDDVKRNYECIDYPNMSDIQKVDFGGPRSGVTIFFVPKKDN